MRCKWCYVPGAPTMPAENAPPHRCSLCRKAARPLGENPSFPFCSGRCKAVDLGRWLTEAYRFPAEAVEPEEMAPPDASRDPYESADPDRPDEEDSHS